MRVQTKDVSTRKFCLFCTILALICALVATTGIPATAKHQRAGAGSTQSLRLPRIPGVKPRNVIFILADDHRYDAMGFLQGQAFLSTPRLDATNGMQIPLYRDRGSQQNLRRQAGAKAAAFPSEWMREKDERN